MNKKILAFSALIFLVPALFFVVVNMNKHQVEPIRYAALPEHSSRSLRLVAIGDSVCKTGSKIAKDKCRALDVKKLVDSISPDYLLFAGDLQYQNGNIKDFNNSFKNVWGDYESKIYPTPGNHEYKTKDALGYKEYISNNKFPKVVQEATSKKLTSYTTSLNDWTLSSVDSNCYLEEGRCNKQVYEGAQDRGGLCSIYMWHHPYYTSGNYSNDSKMKSSIKSLYEIAEINKAEIIINGHEHLYERFANQNVNGQLRTNGPAQFIVGTGGVGLYEEKSKDSNSQKLLPEFGVLVLDLFDSSYSWYFVNLENNVLDAGVSPCY